MNLLITAVQRYRYLRPSLLLSVGLAVLSPFTLLSPKVVAQGATPSNLTLSCTPSPLAAPQAAVCTAHVPAGATGSINIGGSLIPIDAAGAAVLGDAFLSARALDYGLSASYAGDLQYAGSSTNIVVSVQSGSTASNLALTCTPTDASVAEAASCQAQLPAGATGAVGFYINGVPVFAQIDSSGLAQIDTPFMGLPQGSYSIGAGYGGDQTYGFSAAYGSVVVNSSTPTSASVPSNIQLSCSPSVLTPPAVATCTARLPTGSTGTVNIWGNQVKIDPAGVATLGDQFVSAGAGQYYVGASYAGDNTHASSFVYTSVVVNTGSTPTNMSVACVPSAITTSQSSTCTIQGDPGPTGAVAFVSPNGEYFPALDSSGKAVFVLQGSSLPVGQNSIQFGYGGDVNYGYSSGGTTLTVMSTATSATNLALSCTPNPLPQGSQLTCTAQTSAGATGSSSFYLDGTYVGATTVNASGSASFAGTPTLTAGSHSITASYSGDASYGSSSSAFTLTASTSTAGSPSTPPAAGTVLYSYNIAQPGGGSGFDAVGNIVNYSDSVNGVWVAGYDSLNRLTSATQAQISGQPALSFNASALNFCWVYDSFGNRMQQSFSDQPFTGNCQAASSNVLSTVATYDSSAANNRIISAVGADTNYATTTTYVYDAAGNITDDGSYQYLYDGEGRLCASLKYVVGAMTGYLYDAEGRRVSKGSLTSFSCDLSSNGFATTNEYVPGPNGESLTELDGSGNVLHTNAYAGGELIATYDSRGIHFNLKDWLGTRRVQTDYIGNPERTCSGGSFGDLLNCTGTSDATAATEIHFTGKERDTESGLDYFGARYYESSIGRWISPDLPFADQNPENPQSWNLYSYVRNNPLNSIDTNGRVTWLIGGTWHNPKDWTASSPLGREMSNFFDPTDDDVETIEWSGGNSYGARAELSAKIIEAITAHSWKPGEQNNIVCHSHGCNGVMGALPTLTTDGYFVDNLVSLGQPMRGDYPYSGGVDTWYNVYASNDMIQKLGGKVPLFGGRKNSNANNLLVHTGKNLISAHGALHNDSLSRMQWETYIRNAQNANGNGKQDQPDWVDWIKHHNH